MDNVINFPTQFVRDKVRIEKQFAKVIALSPLDEKSKIELNRRLMSAWERHQSGPISINFSLSLPNSITQSEIDGIKSSIQAGIDDLSHSVSEKFNLLIFDLWELEMKLYLKELGF